MVKYCDACGERDVLPQASASVPPTVPAPIAKLLAERARLEKRQEAISVALAKLGYRG